MSAVDQVDHARSVGEAATANGLEVVRDRMRVQIRRSIGLTEAPPPRCTDPELVFLPHDAVARRIHADLAPMLIGGIAALLLQMLHPLAMAGVAHHSDYQRDPLGRLRRTADFLGTTTFGSRPEAEAAIARVQRVHRAVVGVTADGEPYSAGDPVLLAWVHASEVRSFLTAAVVYGPAPLSIGEQDRYVAEMAAVATALGADPVPHDVDGLDRYLEGIRPELRLTGQAKAARNFVLRGAGRRRHRTAYGLTVAAAVGILPAWARCQLHLLAPVAGDRLAVRPVVRTFSSAVRWVTVLPAG